MRRRKKDPAAAGIYLRGTSYWLRYTYEGVQHRLPLHTGDLAEAVKKASHLRGKPIEGKTEELLWDHAIDRYIKDKVAGKRPPHLRGRRLRTFDPQTTAPRTRNVLERFQKFCNQPNRKRKSPAHVVRDDLQAFYDGIRIRSEASARSQVIRVSAFLDHLNCLPGRVDFDSGSKPERREIVVDREESDRWIRECPRDDLKFALFCGFHCGFRRRAIVQARPAWFAADLSTVTIPAREKQQLQNGESIMWRNKDLESCTIPLSKPFREFLAGFLDRSALFCIHPDCFSRPYRWDFRRPFEHYVKSQGRPECTIHAMRHSWLTMLCNSGNHTITEIAAWSGDSIEVIEKHYWKKRAVPGALDDTLEGKRSTNTLKDILRQLETLNEKEFSAEDASAIKTLKKNFSKFDPHNWEWTDNVPERHKELYTLEESVTMRHVFQLLIGDEPNQQISDIDWEEGKFSEIRLRIDLLKRRGDIRFKLGD